MADVYRSVKEPKVSLRRIWSNEPPDAQTAGAYTSTTLVVGDSNWNGQGRMAAE